MADAIDPVLLGGLILAGILMVARVARSLRDDAQWRAWERRRRAERRRGVDRRSAIRSLTAAAQSPVDREAAAHRAWSQRMAGGVEPSNRRPMPARPSSLSPAQAREPTPTDGPVTEQDRADVTAMMGAKGVGAALAWQLVQAERNIQALRTAVEAREPTPTDGPVTEQDRADVTAMMGAKGIGAALAWQLVQAERHIRAAAITVRYSLSGQREDGESHRAARAGRTVRRLATDPWTALDRLRAVPAERLVVFDTETTGLGERAEILEYALVALDGTVLSYSIVRPTARIQSGALAIHGITRQEANKHPRITEHADGLVGLMREKVVVAYNAEFDRRLLEQTFERYQLELPVLDWVCAMRAYQAFTGRYRAAKLERALEASGLDVTATHRAAADAEATRQLVCHLRKPHDAETPGS